LLGDAANMASETCERAMQKADQLADKLLTAENRVQQLELELRQMQVRATQAEKWLVRIHREIQERFFDVETSGRTSSG